MCVLFLKKKMLNGAKPLDSAQVAQMAHFKTSGTLAMLSHFRDLHMFFWFQAGITHPPRLNLLPSIQRAKFKEIRTRTDFMFVIPYRAWEF